MGNLTTWILCNDSELKQKSVGSNESHLHHGEGSYLNIMGSGFKDPEGIEPPVLIFQEGNCIPKGCKHSKDDLEEKTWTVPNLRGMTRLYGGGSSIKWGKYFNTKTLPFIFIGLAVVFYFLTGGK